MNEHRERFSPVVNSRLELEETGRLHKWVSCDGEYYGSAWICKNCGRKSWGWNLWKEDFLPTCTGRVKDLLVAIGKMDEAYEDYKRSGNLQEYERRTEDAETTFYGRVGISGHAGELRYRVGWYRESGYTPDVLAILGEWSL